MGRGKYWKTSFRSSESLRSRERERYVPAAAVTREERSTCARGTWCSASQRDSEGTWHPAPAAQHLCPADRSLMVTDLGEIPSCYDRLAEMALDPVKAGLAIRVPPTSRVHVNPEADALMRLVADTTGAWAARVRSVPQLSLYAHDHAHGSQEQVDADCATLAAHPDPLLALPSGPMMRTWTFPPGRPGFRSPPPVPCRRCGLPLSPSPSGKRWWPAACTHPAASPVTKVVTTFDDDELIEVVTVTGWRCSLCAERFSAEWRPDLAPPCRHQPAGLPPEPAGDLPPDIEAEVGDLDYVRGGDGWVTAWTELDGRYGALAILDLHRRAIALLRENPAPRDLLDGIPCRACDAMSSLEIVPAPPPDPEKPEPLFCRCSDPGCRDEMTRKQYEDWCRQYEAWAKAGGAATCRRCQSGMCGDCSWKACACRALGHAAALFALMAPGVQH